HGSREERDEALDLLQDVGVDRLVESVTAWPDGGDGGAQDASGAGRRPGHVVRLEEPGAPRNGCTAARRMATKTGTMAIPAQHLSDLVMAERPDRGAIAAHLDALD